MPGINQKIRTLILCCGVIAVCLWIFKPTEPPLPSEPAVGNELEPANPEEQLLVTTPVVTTELTIVTEETESLNPVEDENLLPQTLNQGEPLSLAETNAALEQIDPQEQASLLKVDINYMIEQWQDAWQSGDAERYLSFYSETFTPSGDLSRVEWRSQRQTRVSPANPIALSLSNFEVVLEDDNQKAMVSFDQLYESSKHQEQSRKELVLVKDEEWQIIAERELN